MPLRRIKEKPIKKGFVKRILNNKPKIVNKNIIQKEIKSICKSSNCGLKTSLIEERFTNSVMNLKQRGWSNNSIYSYLQLVKEFNAQNVSKKTGFLMVYHSFPLLFEKVVTGAKFDIKLEHLNKVLNKYNLNIINKMSKVYIKDLSVLYKKKMSSGKFEIIDSEAREHIVPTFTSKERLNLIDKVTYEGSLKVLELIKKEFKIRK